VSSIEPNRAGGEINGSEEVAGGLVIASGDGTKLLEFGEEVLDQVARFIEMPIEPAGHPSVGLGRNHGGFALGNQRLDDPFVGVECLFGDQHLGLHVRQKVVGTDQIVRLATGQVEADRIAERIDQGMDLGAQPAARAPDRLVLAIFFLAPALC